MSEAKGREGGEGFVEGCLMTLKSALINTLILLVRPRVKWWNTGHLTTKPSVALSSEDFIMILKRQMVKKL